MERKQIDLAESPIRLIDGWIERAKKEEDVLFKFVGYWIAFTQMYNQNNDRDAVSEITLIKEFCSRNISIIYEAIDFDAEYMRIFKERPILRWTDMTDRYDWRGGRDYITERIMTKFSHYSGKPYFERNCKEAADYYVKICNPRTRPADRAEVLSCRFIGFAAISFMEKRIRTQNETTS